MIILLTQNHFNINGVTFYPKNDFFESHLFCEVRYIDLNFKVRDLIVNTFGVAGRGLSSFTTEACQSSN